jgi:histidinol-phosphatase (PHP family)
LNSVRASVGRRSGLPPDYHMHTERCGHARGRAEDYARQAMLRGLPGIGMSDHLPLLHGRDPELAMDAGELVDYVDEVRELKRRYPGYVLLGIEADYRPDTVSDLRDVLREHPFDYVIGSVHDLDGWAFDDPRIENGFAGRDLDQVYRRYLELVGDAAETGLFTILGHVDLIKKFGHRPCSDPTDWVERLADRVGGTGAAVELNTSGLRKPVGEIYPSQLFLRALAHRGVPLTFGSDAHRPEEVGKDFAAGLAAARDAGYRQHLVLLPLDERPASVAGRLSESQEVGLLKPLPREEPCA